MNPFFHPLFTALLIVFAIGAGTAAAEPAIFPAPSRILFIGNSYTGVNKLPKIFQQIVASAGHPAPEVKSATPGGKTLAKHLDEVESLKLIDEGRWDVVVLQGQSQEAAKPDALDPARASFLTGAHDLCQRIKAASPRARIVFYQTWARHADYWKNAKADPNVGKDPAEMQARNRSSYRRAAAQEKDCSVAPVGDAWELNYRNPQALRLHSPDHSHPTFSGSYLAGLVIYGAIYHPVDFTVPYHGGLKDDEATYLQSIAAQAMNNVAR